MQSLGRGYICLHSLSTAGVYRGFLPPLEGGGGALVGGFLVGGGGLATGLVETGVFRGGVSSATVDVLVGGVGARFTE